MALLGEKHAAFWKEFDKRLYSRVKMLEPLRMQKGRGGLNVIRALRVADVVLPRGERSYFCLPSCFATDSPKGRQSLEKLLWGIITSTITQLACGNCGQKVTFPELCGTTKKIY